MSGGRWDYQDRRVASTLEEIGESLLDSFPALSMALQELAPALRGILHEIDWELSGDGSDIARAPGFEHQALGLLLVSIMKECPDEWFLCGKWATIQAFQARSRCEEFKVSS